MTKFNFHGKLYENNKRVLTEEKIEPEINITMIDSDIVPSGTIEWLSPQESEEIDYNKMKISLWIPRGERGEKGDTGAPPQIKINSVSFIDSSSGRAGDVIWNEEAQGFDFILERGPIGNTPKLKTGIITYTTNENEVGFAFTPVEGSSSTYKADFTLLGPPQLQVKNEIEWVPYGQPAIVEDINKHSRDMLLKFTIPEPPPGQDGPQGKDFEIAEIFNSVEAMSEAWQRLETGAFYYISSDSVEKEENSRLYTIPQITPDEEYDSPKDIRIKNYNGTKTLKFIKFLNDFSGVKGAAAKVNHVEVRQTVKSSEPAYAGVKEIEYVPGTDSYNTTIEFDIPKGASSRITEVAAGTLNSNQSVSISNFNTQYNETDDTQDTSFKINIPKGASARLSEISRGQVLNSNEDPVVNSVAPTYNSETDTWDTKLTLNLPRSASGIAIPTIGEALPSGASNATVEVKEITHEDSYTDSKGNTFNDVNVTSFELRIPKGIVPEFSKGTAQTVNTIEEFNATITFPIDEETGVEDKSKPRLNLWIPVGETPEIKIGTVTPVSADQSPKVKIEYGGPDHDNRTDVTLNFWLPVGHDGEDAEFAGIVETGDGSVVKSIERNTETYELTVNKTSIIDDDIDAENFAKSASVQDAIYSAIEDIILVSTEEPESMRTKLWLRT